ncbi:Integrator complex subunit 5 [Massospora cicadina]|nr:Integrator complex subunit 5 [Massospora cicadina]
MVLALDTPGDEFGPPLVEVSDPTRRPAELNLGDRPLDELSEVAKLLAPRSYIGQPAVGEMASFIRVLLNCTEAVDRDPIRWGKWAIALLYDLYHPDADNHFKPCGFNPSNPVPFGPTHFTHPIRFCLEKVILIGVQAQPALPDFSAAGVFHPSRPGPHVAFDLIESHVPGPAAGPGRRRVLESLLILLPEVFVPALLLNHLHAASPEVPVAPPRAESLVAGIRSSVPLSGLHFFRSRGKLAKELVDGYLMKAIRTYLAAFAPSPDPTASLNLTVWHRNLLSRFLQLPLSTCVPFEDFFNLLTRCDLAQVFRAIACEYRDRWSVVQWRGCGEPKPVVEVWRQFLAYLVSTLASVTPFVDLLWLLDGWLTAYFVSGFCEDAALHPVPKVLTAAMGHLVAMLKETVATGFITELLDPEAPGWMDRLELNPRCLYRVGTGGFCTDPIRLLSDCLLDLLSTEGGVQTRHPLYPARCEALGSAVEQLLANVASPEDLRVRVAHLLSGLQPEALSPTSVGGQYLNRLVRFYFNSLGGSEADFAMILEAADDAQLPNLLHAVGLLAQLGTLALTVRSEVFRATLALAQREFKSQAMVLALAELCLAYLPTHARPVNATPSACYQMGEFGFRALGFAFAERCRTGAALGALAGTLKRLLGRLASVQDPAVFIKQLTPRLLDENLAYPFFCDFAKPAFEAFPLRPAPAADRRPLQPLNLLEALISGRNLEAVTCNLADVMDVCQTLCYTEPESPFLMAEYLGLAVNLCGASGRELSELGFSTVAPRSERDQLILARFKEFPILMDILQLLASEPAAFRKAKEVWGSLLGSFIGFWRGKRTPPSDYPAELHLVRRLVHILGLSKWLPPPLHYASELFAFVTSHEIGLILQESVWPSLLQWGAEAPTLTSAVGKPHLTPAASLIGPAAKGWVGGYLPPILKALKAHAVEAAHLFPLFYFTLRGPVVHHADWQAHTAP